MTLSTAISQAQKPAANTAVTLYGPTPTGLRARVNISGVNQDGDTNATVFVAISQSGEPAVADWIEYGRTLGAAGAGFERTDKWLKPGDYVVVKSNTGAVAFRVDGQQEDNV